MRSITWPSLVAFLVVTLGLQGGPFCVPASAATRYCASVPNCCPGRPDCYLISPIESGHPAVLTPAAPSSLSLPVAVLATVTSDSPNLGRASDGLPMDSGRGPVAGHPQCLGSRAPPLS